MTTTQFFEELDARIAKYDLLCHPFYQAWSAGELTRDDLREYAKDYYQQAPDRNPQGPEEGMYRVLRGGSWADLPKYLTCAYRSWARPGERSPNIGFRCVKSFR